MTETVAQIEAPSQQTSGWMNFADFLALGVAPNEGALVRVFSSSFAGMGSKYHRITKVTASHISLDSGTRFARLTGKQVGTFSKCETRPQITRIYAR